MKKLIVAVLLVASLTGFAQKTKKNGAEKELEKMNTELTLTDVQQESLKPLLLEKMEIKNDTKENPENEEDNKVKLKDLGKKINAVLTPEQKELRKQLKANAEAKPQ